ncbi:MAG: hypothetical protein JSW37_01720 [Anaerolineales bacterium]|nr:MAG: hypothetical protein JSW37_01720 [Anaerolineales bacterium]
MATPTSTAVAPPSLIDHWVKRTGRSWSQAAALLALFLLVFLFGAAYLDGALAAPFDAQAWRGALLYPVISAYVLLIQPAARRLLENALQALRPLVLTDDETFARLVAEEPLFNRRNQWLAFGTGAAFALLFRPWEYFPFWLALYGLVGAALTYGLLGWFVYGTATGSLLGAGWDVAVDANVFELKSLEPVARWGLGIALSYVGGITLSLLLVPEIPRSPETIVIYGVLTAVPLLAFFSSMASTHRIMAEAKEQELETVRSSLAAASTALKRCASEGRTEEMQVLFKLIAGWGAYEKQVEAVPDWPYTAQIRRSLLVSALLPGAVGIGRAVLLEYLLRLVA